MTPCFQHDSYQRSCADCRDMSSGEPMTEHFTDAMIEAGLEQLRSHFDSEQSFVEAIYLAMNEARTTPIDEPPPEARLYAQYLEAAPDEASHTWASRPPAQGEKRMSGPCPLCGEVEILANCATECPERTTPIADEGLGHGHLPDCECDQCFLARRAAAYRTTPINSEGLKRLSWRLNCAISDQVMDSDARRILGAIADDLEAIVKASLPTPVIEDGLVEKAGRAMFELEWFPSGDLPEQEWKDTRDYWMNHARVALKAVNVS